MADARDFLVVDSAGVPLTGAAGGMTALARDITGATRTAPAIVELAFGEYRVVPTDADADETAGTVVLIDTGAGNSPRHVVIECFKADRSNQFWALCVENPDLSLWAGAAPTVGAYRSGAGARTAPTLVAVAGAYLFVAVPSAADVTADTAIRIDGPAGSAQPYWYDDTKPVVSGGLPPVTISTLGANPEAVAAAALRDWLLWQLPASIALVNASRAATLRAPGPGPYVIPAAASLKVSVTDKAGTTTTIALTAGSRTTAQLVTEINATVAGLASADSDDHLLLTSPTAPSWTASTQAIVNSVVAAGADATGTNAALGWDISGEYAIRTPLVPPGPRGVCDGLPLGTYFDPSQIGKGRVLVTIGARESKPKNDNPRNFEHDVFLELGVFRAEPLSVTNQTREPIQAALQAVRSCLLTDEGKQLGRARQGDVVYGRLASANISGQSLTFTQRGANGVVSQFSPFFDAVNCRYLVRVYQAS